MSTQTRNYGFTKDNENDFYDVNTVNNNLDKIDTEIKRIEEKFDESEQTDTKVDNHIEQDDGHVRYIGDAVGQNAKVITTDKLFLEGSPVKPKVGAAFRFKNATHNTGAVTLQIDSPKYGKTSAYNLYNSRGAALKPSDVQGQLFYTVVFTGSAFQLQGEGGGYYTGDTIKVNDLINRHYVDVSQRMAINGGVNFSSLNHEVAIVNGVEYAFSYCTTTSDSHVFCFVASTGQLVWKKNVKYEYRNSRIVVYEGKLYLTIADYNNVLGYGGGIGIEVMDALTGTTLKASPISVSGYNVSNAPDLCLVDINGTKEIMVLAVNYGYYAWLFRFNLDGKLLATSPVLSSINHTNDITPSQIQFASPYVYLASGRVIHGFVANGFSTAVKYTPPENAGYDYFILSIAANNIGGLSFLDYVGYLHVLDVNLFLKTPRIAVNGNKTSGLAIKGDLLGYATPTDIRTYRLAPNGLSVTFLAEFTYPTNVDTTLPSKSIGLSENVVVPPRAYTQEYPAVFAKTLKIQR
ncbi:hypothetical protein ABNX05_25190 [Lysinibacillus sp. M3]|uniref:Uncharacterized protein n=1 Tax=Lysinibacillus zambalensis TaxID=3160866 RepID=A0ABV1MZE5_9BACI